VIDAYLGAHHDQALTESGEAFTDDDVPAPQAAPEATPEEQA
jgi:hypothetical protein